VSFEDITNGSRPRFLLPALWLLLNIIEVNIFEKRICGIGTLSLTFVHFSVFHA